MGAQCIKWNRNLPPFVHFKPILLPSLLCEYKDQSLVKWNVHDFLVMRGLTQLVLYSASGVLKIWFFSVVEVPTKQSSLCNKNCVTVN